MRESIDFSGAAAVKAAQEASGSTLTLKPADQTEAERLVQHKQSERYQTY